LIVWFEQKDSRGRMFKYLIPTRRDIIDLREETMADMKSLWGKLSRKTA